MRWFKKKAVWFALFGIAVTCLFFYLLFPSEWALKHLEAGARTPEMALSADSLKPALPWGFKLKNVSVFHPQTPQIAYFQSDKLDIQPRWWSLPFSVKRVGFSGHAYGGEYQGRISLSSLDLEARLLEGHLTFDRVTINQIDSAYAGMIRGMQGVASGTISLRFAEPSDRFPSGTVSVRLINGIYPLPEPFLGIRQIDFDRGEITGQILNGVLKLERLEFYGPQLNCTLEGEITLAQQLPQSRLNLRGSFELVGQSRIKMQVTIGGTLAAPIFRYI